MEYKFTIVMPALNEEKNITSAISDVIECYKKLSINGEIIVVNDGSTDKTGEIVENLMKTHSFIRVIHHKAPKGIGASYWEAIQIAEGELITYMPGDGESSVYEALRYIDLFEHVDIVIPFIFNREVRSFHRAVISKLYKAIINLSFGTLLNYMNGATIYRRCILNQIELKTTGFFFQVELLIKAIRLGYLYAEVPSALGKRISGKSKAFTFRSFLRICRDYTLTFFSIYLTRNKDKRFHPSSITQRRWTEAKKLCVSVKTSESVNMRKAVEGYP